jgi:hypothetical protein
VVDGAALIHPTGCACSCSMSAAWGTVSAWIKETAMTMYTVGMKLGTRAKALTIEAEDALLAALKSKLENPEALITYVRKSNERGDRRHPHEGLRK